MQRIEQFGTWAGVVLLLLFLSSCATTVAPTEATTDTVGNTSDASTKFTSSTSPGQSSGDSAKVEQFVRENYARVKSDMARGGGEYLESLAVLLQIPSQQHGHFFNMTQSKFTQLYPEPDTTPQAMLATLDQELMVMLGS